LTRRILVHILSRQHYHRRVQVKLSIGLIVACVVAEAAVLHVGIDDLDEGYFVQQATRVLHGQIPYRDFETFYTPGLAYLHALLFGMFGGPSLVAPRVVALVARAALALLLFALARPLVRNPLWAAAPGVFLLVGLDDAPQRWEPHPGWLSTVFAVCAAWCMTRGSARWCFAAGVGAGAAYLFKQNTGIFILAALLVHPFVTATLEETIWARKRKLSSEISWKSSRTTERAKRAGEIAIGFAVFTAMWLIPLLIALGGDTSHLGPLVGAVNQAGLFSPPEISIAVPLLCIMGGIYFWKDLKLRWFLLAGTALFLTQYPRMDTLHLAWSAPILLVVGAVVLDRVAPPWKILAVLGLAAVAAPIVMSRIDLITLPRAPIADVEAPVATARELNGVIADIQDRTQPGEAILVYPTSPLLYVLADRPNPTRFDHLNPGAASQQQIDTVIQDLENARVHLVVISDFWQANWGPPGPNAPLETWLNAHFAREVVRHGAYRVMAASL
jgi:hypothetical protein